VDEQRYKLEQELARAEQRLADAQAELDDSQAQLDAREADLTSARQEARDTLGKHLEVARSTLDEVEDAFADLFTDAAADVPRLVGLQAAIHRLTSATIALDVMLATQLGLSIGLREQKQAVASTIARLDHQHQAHLDQVRAAYAAPETNSAAPRREPSRDPNAEERPVDAR
jgi:chromosome segregation ATPase